MITFLLILTSHLQFCSFFPSNDMQDFGQGAGVRLGRGGFTHVVYELSLPAHFSSLHPLELGTNTLLRNTMPK